MPWQLQQNLTPTRRRAATTQHRSLFSRQRQEPIHLLAMVLLPIDDWQTLVQHGYRIAHRSTPSSNHPAEEPSLNLV
jgi:hypothetical protein